MPGLGQDVAGLPALDPEAVREPRRRLVPARRQVGEHLGVQGLQLVRVRRGGGPVEHLEREVGWEHTHFLSGPGP